MQNLQTLTINCLDWFVAEIAFAAACKSALLEIYPPEFDREVISENCGNEIWIFVSSVKFIFVNVF